MTKIIKFEKCPIYSPLTPDQPPPKGGRYVINILPINRPKRPPCFEGVCLNSKLSNFQTVILSNFLHDGQPEGGQTFKLSNLTPSDLQAFKLSNFQTFKLSNVQHFKISNSPNSNFSRLGFHLGARKT